MNKFLGKRRKTNDTNIPVGRSSIVSLPSPHETSSKYQATYLAFGFTYVGSEGSPLPRCLVCGHI